MKIYLVNLKTNTLKTIISLTIAGLIITVYSCSTAEDKRGLDEQIAMKNDSILIANEDKGREHFSDSVFAFYDSIKISKEWKQIQDTNNILAFDYTTAPSLVIFSGGPHNKGFSGYLKGFETFKDSICFYSNEFDSLTTFIYKPLKNNKALWCVCKPQINYYIKLGVYKPSNMQ